MSDCLLPCGLWLARPLSPWDSPGKYIGVGCHVLLQRIFLTQGLNPQEEGRAPVNQPLGHVYSAIRILSQDWNLDARAHHGMLRRQASDTSWFWLLNAEELVILLMVKGRILGCHLGEIFTTTAEHTDWYPKENIAKKMGCDPRNKYSMGKGTGRNAYKWWKGRQTTTIGPHLALLVQHFPIICYVVTWGGREVIFIKSACQRHACWMCHRTSQSDFPGNGRTLQDSLFGSFSHMSWTAFYRELCVLVSLLSWSFTTEFILPLI